MPRPTYGFVALMTITLSHNQQRWLEAQVEAGNFASIEEAVAIAGLKTMDAGDLSWAKPYIEQARASAAAGNAISREAFAEELGRKIDALRGG